MQDARGRHDGAALLIASGYVALTATAAHLVNRIVDEPYLDEIFHIPQAQRYCRNEWHGYDAKLTTPPGLYVLSVAGARVVAFLQKASMISKQGKGPSARDYYPCQTVAQLRYICLLAVLALPWILSFNLRAAGRAIRFKAATPKNTTKPTSPMEALVQAEADPAKAAQTARSTVAIRRAEVLRQRRRGIFGIIGSTLEDRKLTLAIHTISCLPPLWFFGLLYYTDAPSTALVMAMLAAARDDRHALASVIGLISLSLRQTNIVWVIFALGEAALRALTESGLDNRPLSQSSISNQLASLKSALHGSTARKIGILIAHYLPVIALTAGFILKNGTIVLGDRENHQASKHWIQPWYGIAFATLFAWPALLSSTMTTDKKSIKRAIAQVSKPLPLLVAALFSLAACHFGTVTHPFLLADNRHYAFYVWRRLIDRTPWTRYVLAVLYAFAGRAWWIALAESCSVFWILGFASCFCAAVIPSPLIEPRYFLVPFLVARLQLCSRRKEAQSDVQSNAARPASIAPVLAELTIYVVMNVVTLYIFLEKPFKWADTDGLQRFMW